MKKIVIFFMIILLILSMGCSKEINSENNQSVLKEVGSLESIPEIETPLSNMKKEILFSENLSLINVSDLVSEEKLEKKELTINKDQMIEILIKIVRQEYDFTEKSFDEIVNNLAAADVSEYEFRDILKEYLRKSEYELPNQYVMKNLVLLKNICDYIGKGDFVLEVLDYLTSSEKIIFEKI